MPVKVLSIGLCLPDMAAGDNEIEQHRNFSKTHFQRVATFVSPDGQETTKCLWLAKDMLPDTGMVKKPGR